MIQVSKPFLPPRKEYNEYIKGIWDRNHLTNNGPLLKELEQRLKSFLALENLLVLNNGTIAIQIAIKALELKGEIITTPFSYVATTSSIIWENCYPVFVDINESSLNIEPNRIEKAITENTSAILATHVFGNPCEVEIIRKIANKYKIKVIYDAAHCFATKICNNSILTYGDISTISFHATKIYHTIEGGAVITPHKNLIEKMKLLRNFGHNGPHKYAAVGINGKNSEFHAAMGLCNLKYIDDILSKRKVQYLHYKNELNSTNIKFQEINSVADYNYSYFPVIFQSEKLLLDVTEKLKSNEIYPRRYFYPSLNKLEYLQYKKCPVSEFISSRILCLPIYHELTIAEQDKIIKIINSIC